MATKETAKDAPKEKAPKATNPGDVRSGVDIPAADREVLSGTIDERMEALLDDHIRMGARPPREK